MLNANNDLLKVGGQAVIEGVMMRSPNSMAIAVRRPSGEIVIREQAWISLWERWKFLKWPLLRGSIILFESMYNGIQALTFSANQAVEEEDSEEKLSPWAMAATIALALVFGLGLFVVIPHFLTQLLGDTAKLEMSVSGILFHVVDGIIKILFFIGYVWGISKFKDIKRVFQYHGAEHMSIFAYEKGLDLTVENARKFGTLHPRCGTSFLMVVILVSILFFSVLFPLMPELAGVHKILRHLIYVAIKIPLMFPIAGLSYEVIKLAGKKENNPVLRLFTMPGVLLQKITTQPPTDDMLEVALLSLRKVLWRESVGYAGGEASEEVYPDFDKAIAQVGVNH